MENCIIVCAGDFSPDIFEYEQNSFIIAADGGAKYLNDIGIKPNLAIGDWDSLGYTPSGDNVVKLPCEKDITDSFAAYSEGVKRGYVNFYIYGALGGKRFSHSMANMQLLLKIKNDGNNAVLKDKNCTVRVLHNEEVYYESKNCVISFLSASDNSEISIEGMKYPLCHKRITSDYPLGVSNELIGKRAKVTVHKGYVYEITEM